MGGADFAVTAGWGHYGKDNAVMPGQGRVVERSYTPDERTILGDALPVLGKNTFDVHLNGSRFLAQRARYSLDLPARRLPSTQEVVVLPRIRCPRAGTVAGGSPALHRYLAADRGDSVEYRLMSLTQLAPEEDGNG